MSRMYNTTDGDFESFRSGKSKKLPYEWIGTFTDFQCAIGK